MAWRAAALSHKDCGQPSLVAPVRVYTPIRNNKFHANDYESYFIIFGRGNPYIIVFLLHKNESMHICMYLCICKRKTLQLFIRFLWNLTILLKAYMNRFFEDNESYENAEVKGKGDQNHPPINIHYELITNGLLKYG